MTHIKHKDLIIAEDHELMLHAIIERTSNPLCRLITLEAVHRERLTSTFRSGALMWGMSGAKWCKKCGEVVKKIGKPAKKRKPKVAVRPPKHTDCVE